MGLLEAELGAAVFGPAGVVGASGELRALGEGADAGGVDAQAGEVVFDDQGAALPQGEVVLLGAARVGEAGDDDLLGGVIGLVGARGVGLQGLGVVALD